MDTFRFRSPSKGEQKKDQKMMGKDLMLATVDHYRSLTFEDLEKKVEYSEGIPFYLADAPWRVPHTNNNAKIINEVLGI